MCSYLTRVCFLLFFAKKGVSKIICYVNICCFVHEPRGARSVFSYSWEGFEATPGLRWRFLLPGVDKGVSVKVLFC